MRLYRINSSANLPKYTISLSVLLIKFVFGIISAQEPSCFSKQNLLLVHWSPDKVEQLIISFFINSFNRFLSNCVNSTLFLINFRNNKSTSFNFFKYTIFSELTNPSKFSFMSR